MDCEGSRSVVVKGSGIFKRPDEDSLSPPGGQVGPGQRAESGRGGLVRAPAPEGS